MIFVTGATGFIGQRLVERLRNYGDTILNSNGRIKCRVPIKVLSRSQHPEFETVVCDLQREVIPDGALEGVDTVFHLAGFAHDVRDAAELEGLYRKVNVDATVRLAELAVRAGVNRFVFISSVKAGGGAGIDGAPDGIYGKTKREAELRLLEITQQSNMHVVIVRPVLVYGPGVKGNLALMQSAIKAGWFPPLPETGNRRSMIHVDELVETLLRVAEDKSANREVVIATDGKSYSSREIYEMLCRSVGKPVPKWSVPKFLFDLVGLLSPRIRYKIDKLLGDE